MAHLLSSFILIFCFAGTATADRRSSAQPSLKKCDAEAENPLVDEMLRHVGVPYEWGGSDPGGLDCSGYVGLVYRNACGLDLPRHSRSLYLSSDLQKVSLDELQTGDLLFFALSKGSRRINHVGIYLSGGRFVHASLTLGVIVSRLDEKYYSDRIAGARRVPEQPQSHFPGTASTPSESEPDHRWGLHETVPPGRSLGLNLTPGTNGDDWRISTTFHPLSLTPGSHGRKDRGQEGMNLSLSYSRRLSEGMTVFLTGERLLRSAAPLHDLTEHRGVSEDQRVSLLFNFSY
jgi:hypothetical protein